MYMGINPPLFFGKNSIINNKSQDKRGRNAFAASYRKRRGVSRSIFRSYDIRGVYPSTINQDSAYLIGRAFVKFLSLKTNGSRPGRELTPRVVVGRDNRLSSPVLFRSLIRGIAEEGAEVVDIGLATTPMLYWACGFYGYDGGINITASHNPREHNGFKLVKKRAVPVREKTGLNQIYNLLY